MTVQTETPAVTSKPPAAVPTWRRWITVLAPLWTLLALGLFFSITSQTFLRPINLNNILVQISTLAIFGTGLTFVLLTGEIDLSVAALAGLSGMLSAHLFTNLGWPDPWASFIGVGAATLLGLLSGLASVRFRIPTFMATLAVQLIATGLVLFISQGRVVNVTPLSDTLGTERIGGPGGVQILIVVALITLLIGHLVLRYTRFGRYIYMTGASKPAARLAGVNTDRIIIIALTICGFTAGIAGIVHAGRVASAQPQINGDFLIDAIGAVVLGGTSLNGGRGGIMQTIIGLLIYGTLRNGLDNIPQIDPMLKKVITGIVLLGALVVNLLFSGKAPRDRTG